MKDTELSVQWAPSIVLKERNTHIYVLLRKVRF